MTADVMTDNFPLYVGAGIPRLARFENTRIAAVLIGPGVGTPDTPPAGVPPEVNLAIPTGEGAVLYVAPQDQSTCAYVDAPTPFATSEHTHEVLGRCNFYESWGGSDSWPQVDKVTTVGAGTYKVAFWAFEGTDTAVVSTGKFWATLSDDTMAEYFGPVKAHTCGTTPVAACGAADLTTDPSAAQTTCEAAGACTYAAACAGGMCGAPADESCAATPVAACGSADITLANPQTTCEAAGACTYSGEATCSDAANTGGGPAATADKAACEATMCDPDGPMGPAPAVPCEFSPATAGPAAAWGPEIYPGGGGMGPGGGFSVPMNQAITFYEAGHHAGMANMPPASTTCVNCAYGSGHGGTPGASCPTGCEGTGDDQANCATVSACPSADLTTDPSAAQTTCEAAGACTYTAACAGYAAGCGAPTAEGCAATQDDCNMHRDYDAAGELKCVGVAGAVAAGTSELTVTPCTANEIAAAAAKLCPLVASTLAQCDTLVSSAKANPAAAQPAMQSNCGTNSNWAATIPAATLADYCATECPAGAAAHCAAYEASACTDAFEGCVATFNAMPAGTAAYEAGTQACVAHHLTLADAADSAHCAHARGEGPCAAPAAVTPAKASGATVALPAAAMLVVAALLQ